MKSTLFASTLAAALTATSFGQVEVELITACCNDSWSHTYLNEILAFDTTNEYGYTGWAILVPEETIVSFILSWNTGVGSPEIYDFASGTNSGPFASIVDAWYAQEGPSAWSGTFVLPAGSYQVQFYEFEGTIHFNSAVGAEGSCCVNSGCSSTGETTCTELGGTWTEGGSCDDCEPVADDCPADVDGDGSIGFSDVLIILSNWGACP